MSPILMNDGRAAVLVRNLFLLLLVFSLTSIGRTRNYDAAGLSFVPLPTRVRVQDRIPDLVISEDLLRGLAPFHNIVLGDFNGDGIRDLSVINSLADGSFPQTGRASLILGKSSLGGTGGINLVSGPAV